jgi:hypothetical protein
MPPARPFGGPCRLTRPRGASAPAGLRVGGGAVAAGPRQMEVDEPGEGRRALRRVGLEGDPAQQTRLVERDALAGEDVQEGARKADRASPSSTGWTKQASRQARAVRERTGSTATSKAPVSSACRAPESPVARSGCRRISARARRAQRRPALETVRGGRSGGGAGLRGSERRRPPGVRCSPFAGRTAPGRRGRGRGGWAPTGRARAPAPLAGPTHCRRDARAGSHRPRSGSGLTNRRSQLPGCPSARGVAQPDPARPEERVGRLRRVRGAAPSSPA